MPSPPLRLLPTASPLSLPNRVLPPLFSAAIALTFPGSFHGHLPLRPSFVLPRDSLLPPLSIPCLTVAPPGLAAAPAIILVSSHKDGRPLLFLPSTASIYYYYRPLSPLLAAAVFHRQGQTLSRFPRFLRFPCFHAPSLPSLPLSAAFPLLLSSLLLAVALCHCSCYLLLLPLLLRRFFHY